MLTEHELNPRGIKLNKELRANFLYHYFVMNEFRAAYAKPMTVRSGVRSKAEHYTIYMDKNERRVANGLAPIPIPQNSAHLLAAATDIEDLDHGIYRFCETHIDLLTDLGIYLECKDFTPTWIHMQTVPPKSFRRFFVPF